MMSHILLIIIMPRIAQESSIYLFPLWSLIIVVLIINVDNYCYPYIYDQVIVKVNGCKLVLKIKNKVLNFEHNF